MEVPKLNRQLAYLGSSKKDAGDLPKEVQEIFATALKMALNGETHEDAKLFKHYGSGIFEVVSDFRGDAFREIYTVRYPEIVFVIHVLNLPSLNKGRGFF